MSKDLLVKTDRMIDPLRMLAQRVGEPAFDLAIRLFMAKQFFVSGWDSLQEAIDGNWAATVFLYKEEYHVPLLPPEVAAVLGTGGEVVFPVLLVFGLFGRFAAAGLLIMTMVIEFTYVHNIQHVMWALLLLSIFVRGPGFLSLDTLILRWIRKAAI